MNLNLRKLSKTSKEKSKFIIINDGSMMIQMNI